MKGQVVSEHTFFLIAAFRYLRYVGTSGKDILKEGSSQPVYTLVLTSGAYSETDTQAFMWRHTEDGHFFIFLFFL